MKKTIIYIIGSGRSGTTLLDVILGNADDIFSAGELNRYPDENGIQTGLQNQPERTVFWRGFAEEFQEKYNYDLSKQAKINREIEYHSGWLKRAVGRLDQEVYKDYQEFTQNFFQLLFDKTEENIIVDSSKYPGRAFALADSLPYRICYLYIKRNPIGVVDSFAKTDMFIKTKNWSSANAYYLSVNHLCKLAIRKLRKNHEVHEVMYEDLIAEPEKILDGIQNAFNIDLSRVRDIISRDEDLIMGDLFAGNTLRMKESIKLRRGHKKYPMNFRNGVTRIINSSIY